MSFMKKILLVLLVLVLAGAGIGVYMWNKPPETVDNKKAEAITAEALAKAFTDNEQKANAAYLNQVLDVTGTVAEVSKNQDGKTVIVLSVSDPLSGIQCTMRDDGVQAQVGSAMTIKGFCNGYTLVVLLSDCIVK
jgi:anionic cell wall polymer biosynthesis LytR-Cps2A-Psr (LCP) family protein